MRDAARYPIEYQKCTGCGVCVNICDCKAIEMSPEDKEGFKYPVIKESCISCGRCREICPQNNPIKSNEIKEAYAAFTLCGQIREQSSSGGIFYELAQCVVDNGGVVCGAAYDENLYVKHILVKDKEELYSLMVSKYMQSDTENVYDQVAGELKKGKKLLFSGTPCQVHALKMYLDSMQIEGDIITIDLLCFGIPSPKAAHKSMEETEKEYQKRIKYVTLKDKTYGWHKPKTKYIFEDETSVIIEKDEEDYFAKAFLADKFAIRRSCFECKYKIEDRVSDITIGDFWGMKDVEMDDDKGTSAVMIHSCKGRELFQKLIDGGRLKYKKCEPEIIISGNPEAFRNKFFFDEERRKYFWELLERESFATAVIMAEKME